MNGRDWERESPMPIDGPDAAEGALEGVDLNPEDLEPGKGRTLRADAMRRLRKNKLALAGLTWIIIVILVAVTADLWVPQWLGDPVEIDSATVAERSLLPPSVDHPFGTDKLGRDIASRVIYGARVSLIVGVVAVLIMVVIGLILGAIAAYYGGSGTA